MARPTTLSLAARMGLAVLCFWATIAAQQDPRQLLEQLQAINKQAHELLTWHRHLGDNARKIAAGETGRMVISVPASDGQPASGRVRIIVREPIPRLARQGGRLTAAKHFVEIGSTLPTEALEVRAIPTGLALEIVVWPEDRSAPRTVHHVVGPKRRGEVVTADAPLAVPYPIITGRLLHRDGTPAGSCDVAIEVRCNHARFHQQGRTDPSGRFEATVRHAVHAPQTGGITVTPGKLVRHGSRRCFTTEMPNGGRAVGRLSWPLAAKVTLGDLRLQR